MSESKAGQSGAYAPGASGATRARARPDAALDPRARSPRFAVVALLALLAYGGCAWLLGRTTPAASAYFDHLADAFLHGRLHLAPPPSEYDLTQHEGRWYVPFPPLPALLLTPWVAVMGLARTNALYLSLLAGALNVALVWRLLGALLVAERRLSMGARTWLTMLFAFSSTHWLMAMDGSVWYLAQVCTLAFSLLATDAALRGAPAWQAGAWLAVAMLGRPNVVFLWPLLLGAAWSRATPRSEQPEPDLRAPAPRESSPQMSATHGSRALGRWALRSLAPVIAALALLGAYNYARFSNPLDFGYATQNVSGAVRDDLRTYGQFNVRFIARNAYVLLLGPPRWPADSAWPRPDDRGMSLLLTTPALFMLVGARRRDALTRGAWLAVALSLAPLLLYYNTGWRQFGYRFSLDFFPALLALLASASAGRVSRLMNALIALGIAVNAWGVIWWYTRWLD